MAAVNRSSEAGMDRSSGEVADAAFFSAAAAHYSQGRVSTGGSGGGSRPPSVSRMRHSSSGATQEQLRQFGQSSAAPRVDQTGPEPVSEGAHEVAVCSFHTCIKYIYVYFMCAAAEGEFRMMWQDIFPWKFEWSEASRLFEIKYPLRHG